MFVILMHSDLEKGSFHVKKLSLNRASAFKLSTQLPFKINVIPTTRLDG